MPRASGVGEICGEMPPALVDAKGFSGALGFMDARMLWEILELNFLNLDIVNRYHFVTRN